MGKRRHTGEAAEATKGDMGIRLSHIITFLSTCQQIQTAMSNKEVQVSRLSVILHAVSGNGIHLNGNIGASQLFNVA